MLNKRERWMLIDILAKMTYSPNDSPTIYADEIKRLFRISDDDDDMDSALMNRAIRLVVGNAGEPFEDALIDMWLSHSRKEMEQKLENLHTMRRELAVIANKPWPEEKFVWKKESPEE